MRHGGRPSDSIETRTSWVVAGVALTVLTISYGAPLITVVALKPIALEFGITWSAPALAVSLTYIGPAWAGSRWAGSQVVLGCGAWRWAAAR